MNIPHYSSKEMMEKRLLTAFRLCGEVDIDGDNDEYGAENASQASNRSNSDYNSYNDN